MNLIRANQGGPTFWPKCIGCGQFVQAGEGSDAFADLDGEPFVAFYCGMCARALDGEHTLERVTAYLAREVAWELRGDGRECDRTRVYDVTDAAVIIMARRADMELARRRAAEVVCACENNGDYCRACQERGR